MPMPYIVSAGEESEEPASRKKTKQAIRICALGTGIGLGLSLVLDANPGILAAMLSNLKDVGLAIWSALCSVADSLAHFVHYFKNMTLG
jgi:hypothetical protein